MDLGFAYLLHNLLLEDRQFLGCQRIGFANHRHNIYLTERKEITKLNFLLLIANEIFSKYFLRKYNTEKMRVPVKNCTHVAPKPTLEYLFKMSGN